MTCYICLEDSNRKFVTLDCGHKFHRLCIAKIHKPECPLCRKGITGIDPKILKRIRHLETKDCKITLLERELAATLLQLEEYEKMIYEIQIL